MNEDGLEKCHKCHSKPSVWKGSLGAVTIHCIKCGFHPRTRGSFELARDQWNEFWETRNKRGYKERTEYVYVWIVSFDSEYYGKIDSKIFEDRAAAYFYRDERVWMDEETNNTEKGKWIVERYKAA